MKKHSKGLSKQGLINKFYSSQKERCKKRGHSPPSYNLDELKEWIKTNEVLFNKLYANWYNSKYLIDLIPSIDRIDNSKSYNFNNIRLVTWKENRENWYLDNSRNVIQFDLSGKLIKEYKNSVEAKKETNINNIPIAAEGSLKTAGNCLWIYKDDFNNKLLKSKTKLASERKHKGNVLRTVLQIDIEGTVVQEFKSINDAFKKTNIKDISRVISGHYTKAGGYIWFYKDKFSQEALKTKIDLVKETSKDICVILDNVKCIFNNIKDYMTYRVSNGLKFIPESTIYHRLNSEFNKEYFYLYR